MTKPKMRTPTPAATGMGVKNHKLAGRRFTPFYIDPFDPAIPFGTLATAIVRELDRRNRVAARAAKVTG